MRDFQGWQLTQWINRRLRNPKKTTTGVAGGRVENKSVHKKHRCARKNAVKGKVTVAVFFLGMGKTMAEFMADLFLIVWWVGIPEDFLTWWFPVISTTLFSESLKCCRAVANWDVETTRRMIGSQHCETRCLCHHFFHLADCKLTCVFQVKDLWYNHSRQKRKLSLSLSLFLNIYVYIYILSYSPGN